MLHLKFRTGETLLIGDEGAEQVRVTVLSVGHDTVRLAIAAPDAVPVHREATVQKYGPLPSLARSVRPMTDGGG